MKDKHTYGKKMARQGRTKVIYKGTFVSKQSLLTQHSLSFINLIQENKRINYERDLRLLYIS